METEEFKSKSNAIEKSISKEFNCDNIWKQVDESGNGNDNNGNWTLAVKKILFLIAKNINKNIQVASSHADFHDNSEWLYDVVWYIENKYGLDSIELIVESEWKTPLRFQNKDYEYFYNIKYDFEKLIVGKAKQRLLIFEEIDTEKINNIILKCKDILLNSQIVFENERFMFAGWNQKDQDFLFDLFIK